MTDFLAKTVYLSITCDNIARAILRLVKRRLKARKNRIGLFTKGLEKVKYPIYNTGTIGFIIGILKAVNPTESGSFKTVDPTESGSFKSSGPY